MLTPKDKLNIEILPDGTLKITTDGVSMANHMSAEALLRMANTIMGGETKRVRRIDANIDLTASYHDHIHDGHTHSHA